MEDSINTVKFAPGTLARKRLMQTGDLELVHLSSSDFFWGQNRKGDGKNLLGKVLMHMRNSGCDCSVVEMMSKINNCEVENERFLEEKIIYQG